MTLSEKIQKLDRLLAISDTEAKSLASPKSSASVQQKEGLLELHFQRPRFRSITLEPKGKLGLGLANRKETGTLQVTKVEADGFVAQHGISQDTLRPDDRIVSVNGVNETAAQMARQLVLKRLELTVCSYE